MTEKIEAFWGNATADDVARVMAGETVEARFRDVETEPWTTPRALGGWSNQGWVSGLTWNHCQVYREPSWYANKPDPGPGFRLLEKFPDEELKPGDDAWDVWNDKQWRESDSANGRLPQGKDIWYRRRIKPVEPKFAVGQTVKVIGPKGPVARHCDSEMDRHAGTLQTVKYIEEFANPTEIFYGVYGIDSRKFWEDHLEAVEPVEHYLGKVEAIKQFIVGDTFWHPNGLLLKITEKGFEVSQ
jgi:hypothetical protein